MPWPITPGAWSSVRNPGVRPYRAGCRRGSPAAGSSKTSGYPTVVYACGEYDSVGRDVSSSLEGDLCQKSLDGGQTWIVAGQGFFGSPGSTHPQCSGQQESPNFSPWAAPDPR